MVTVYTATSRMFCALFALGVCFNSPHVNASGTEFLPAFGHAMTESQQQFSQTQAVALRSLQTKHQWQGQLAVNLADYSIATPSTTTLVDGCSRHTILTLQRQVNPNWSIGGSANLGNADLSDNKQTFRVVTENMAISAFMLFDVDRYHSSGWISHSAIRFGDLYRPNPTTNNQLIPVADTTGTVTAVELSTYYDLSFDQGRWQYGPQIDIHYSRISVGDYRDLEPAGPVAVGEQVHRRYTVTPAIFAQYLNADQSLIFTYKLGLQKEHKIQDNTAVISNDLGVEVGRLQYRSDPDSRIISTANLTYTPNNKARISVIYTRAGGQSSQDSVALGLTQHF